MAALGSLGAIAILPAAAAVVVALVLFFMWLRRQSRRPRMRPARGESELLRLYDRLQRKAGRRRAPPETPREYLSIAAPSALLAEVTQAVNEGAYAGRWPEPEQVREMAERIS
jgi:hypothetical protein